MITEIATIEFEACPAFRAGDDLLVCTCGWLEDDHVAHPTPLVPAVRPLRTAARQRAPRAVRIPERRAS